MLPFSFLIVILSINMFSKILTIIFNNMLKVRYNKKEAKTEERNLIFKRGLTWREMKELSLKNAKKAE